MTKLAIVGAGSTYTPLLLDQLFSSVLKNDIHEVALMDTDESRLRVVVDFAERMKAKHGSTMRLTPTLDMSTAMKGTRIAIPQVRVGQMKARIQDELLGRKYGIVGQETTGIGGFAKAMRTIPVLKSMALHLEKVGDKNAWIVNFTNPVGIVTEALARFQSIPVVGICNGSLTMQKGFADALGCPMDQLEIDYVGPNHFAFVLDVRRHGKSEYPAILAKMSDVPTAKNITRVKMAPEIVTRCHVIPTGYHKYFFHTNAVVLEDQTTNSRAERVLEIEKKLLEAYADPSVVEVPEVAKDRGGAYYNVVAHDVIACLLGVEKKRVIVAVPNQGYVHGFENQHILEMPCMVSENGVERMGPREWPVFVRGLSQQIKAYEELAAIAGWKGDRDLAYQALLVNPLLPDADVTATILDDMLTMFQAYLPQFRR